MDIPLGLAYDLVAMTTHSSDKFDVLRNIVEQLKGLPSEDQDRIIRWACEELGISVPTRSTASTTALVPPSAALGVVSEVTHSGGSTDIKTFVDEKNPQTDIHFAVVVTYYYRFIAPEKKDAITPDDLQEAARLAGRARLSKPSKTMSNAMSAGLLDSAGRALYKINTVGENLVAIVLPGDVKGNGSISKRRTAKKANVQKKTPSTKGK